MGGSSKKTTVGYKYHLGMHLMLCHGPIDNITKFNMGDKDAWVGTSTGGEVVVNAPDLFGGESREGGVSGTLDFETGEPTQTPNAYLAALLTDLPAFRGVAALVLRRMYLGLNPYIKRIAVQAQRIHLRQSEGLEQWYDEKAEISDDTDITARTPWETDANTVLLIHAEGVHGSDDIVCSSDFPRPIFVEDAELDSNQHAVGNSSINHQTGTYNVDMGAAVMNFDWCVELWLLAPGSGNILVMEGGGTLGNGQFSGYGGPALTIDTDIDDGDWHHYRINRSGSTMRAFLDGVQVDSDTYADPVDMQTIDFVQSEGWADEIRVSNVSRGTATFVPNPPAVIVPARADMNPAHIIRECLTDPDWGLGYAEEDMDDEAFELAADTLFDEFFGLSLMWDRQIPIEDFIKEILKHIDAALYVSRTTGKFVLKLIRNGDVDEGTITLDETNVESVADFTRRGFDELVNSVTVKYSNGDTWTEGSVEAQDIAQIQMQGAIIGATMQYPGITYASLASKIAARDLNTLSTPLISCVLIANQDASHLNIGDPFYFTWPEYEIEEVLMRVTGLNLGDGVKNEVRIQATQDAFKQPTTRYVVSDPTEWEESSGEPIASPHSIAFEMPYYELVQLLGQTDTDIRLSTNEDLGYVGPAAVTSAGAINAICSIDAGAGYEDAGVFNFCPSATIAADITQASTTVTLANGSSLDNVVDGSHAQIGTEIIVVDSLVGTTLTFGRGALDTCPRAHSSGARIMFWDRHAFADSTEYGDSEVVDVKVRPVTGQGALALADATELTVTLDSRAIRPYPPGQVRIGGDYYPEYVEGDVVVTYVHRDRLQQTGGVILDFLDATVGPEDNTTYSARILEAANEANVLDSETGVSGTSITLAAPAFEGGAMLEVWSVRDGFESMQRHRIAFGLNNTPGSPALVFEDNFTDVDGTDIDDHTPDTAPPGFVWTADDFGEIYDNRLALGAGGISNEFTPVPINFPCVVTIARYPNSGTPEIHLLNASFVEIEVRISATQVTVNIEDDDVQAFNHGLDATTVQIEAEVTIDADGYEVKANGVSIGTRTWANTITQFDQIQIDIGSSIVDYVSVVC